MNNPPLFAQKNKYSPPSSTFRFKYAILYCNSCMSLLWGRVETYSMAARLTPKFFSVSLGWQLYDKSNYCLVINFYLKIKYFFGWQGGVYSRGVLHLLGEKCGVYLRGFQSRVLSEEGYLSFFGSRGAQKSFKNFRRGGARLPPPAPLLRPCSYRVMMVMIWRKTRSKC